MKNREKSVFKLTVFFILAVFISGSVLTYMSINNISNLKELAEKNILEEEGELAVLISRNFQEALEEVSNTLALEVDSAQDYENLFRSREKPDFIGDRFVMDAKGNFVNPFYIDGVDGDIEAVSSENFLFYYSKAENMEFTVQNNAETEKAYHTAMTYALTKYDSAKCTNALARFNVKMNNYGKAIDLYTTIISKYYSVMDNYCTPYVHYAIPQLIKINRGNKPEVIMEIMDQCLAGMVSGEIPLNSSSGDILDQIVEWTEQNQEDSNKSVQGINELIQKIRIQLSFINDYGGLIRKYIKISDLESKPKLGDHHIISGFAEHPEMALIVNHTQEDILGYTVRFDRLWNTALSKIEWSDAEFEYNVELTDNSNNNSRIDKLQTITPLSQYFPPIMIRLSLKDELLLKQYVLRRSWAYGIALVLLIGGMAMGVNLIIRDIKREKRMAFLRADFVSNVTHELKTPLTSIRMFAESIFKGQTKTESDQKNFSNIIIKESDNLLRMINNILTFSIREDRNLNYQFKETDLSQLVHSILEEMKYWFDLQKFNVAADIADSIVGSVDPAAIKQALSNIINNAIKYSPVNKNISIRLYKIDNKIIIEVEDTGIGIPEQEIPLIFKKFYRARSKSAEQASGTGIGLTVTRDIIEAHGGAIEVKSVLNKGSTFKIILNS
jgi:signal transduction histidine kinase